MHQFSFGGMIRVGVIVEGILGRIGEGGRVREFIMHEQAAEFDADKFLGEWLVGEMSQTS